MLNVPKKANDAMHLSMLTGFEVRRRVYLCLIQTVKVCPYVFAVIFVFYYTNSSQLCLAYTFLYVCSPLTLDLVYVEKCFLVGLFVFFFFSLCK